MKNYGPINECQVCDRNNLQSVLFVGFLPPVNTMRPIGQPADRECWFPAELLFCPDCLLVQLGYAADPKILFPPEYPYTSSSTRILRENFADLCREVQARTGPPNGDLVVDIGSNDGTLLSNFLHSGYRVVGIEPTLTAKIAEEQNIPTLMSLFDNKSVMAVRREHGIPKLVTAANVFAHIHDVHEVVDNIGELLDPDGVFISESHYLGGLIDTLQYDTIYHEHLRYYSLSSIKHLLQTHGYRIFHVKRIPTHGGSIRVYASRSDKYPLDPSVDELLAEEQAAGLTTDSWIAGFRERVLQSKLDLYEILAGLKRDKLKIYGIGAPSRGSTLVNHTGLDDSLLDCVLELPGSKKVGHYIPGTSIPVLDEAKLYADQPPYVLLLSWHIASELCVNLKNHGYRGDFIVPLPQPHIIRNEQVQVA